MPKWIDEKPTMQLRILRKRIIRVERDVKFETEVIERLQQKWKISRGEGGQVIYEDVWRDVAIVSEEGN